jgi:hypothetical protein
MHGAAALAVIAEPAGNRRAPVAALRDVAGQFEFIDHQLSNSRAMVRGLIGRVRLAGKSITGKRRHDDGERVFRIAAEALGMRQRLDDVQEFEHRSRPAMAEDQRARRWARTVDAIEMDVDVFDLRGELRKAVELRFPFAPVVAFDPIGAELAHEIEIGAVSPAAFEPRPRGISCHS